MTRCVNTIIRRVRKIVVYNCVIVRKRHYDAPLEMPFILKPELINTIFAQSIHLLKLLNPIFEITKNIKMSSARNILWLNILQIKAKPYIWFKARF